MADYTGDVLVKHVYELYKPKEKIEDVLERIPGLDANDKTRVRSLCYRLKKKMKEAKTEKAFLAANKDWLEKVWIHRRYPPATNGECGGKRRTVYGLFFWDGDGTTDCIQFVPALSAEPTS